MIVLLFWREISFLVPPWINVLLFVQQDDVPDGGRAAQRHGVHPQRSRHHDQPRPHEAAGALQRRDGAHEDHPGLHPQPVHGAAQVLLAGEGTPGR